jgi:hypothetical protein
MRKSATRVLAAMVVAVLSACGGSDGPSKYGEWTQITGAVIDAHIVNALVCVDLNANGRCDGDEPQTRSDASGQYRIDIPKDSGLPLLAYINAGEAQESSQPVDASYVMASPSAYSSDITPFTTLVHLTHESNLPLAEDMVRGLLGLPPRFDVHVHAPAAPGSLAAGVVKSVVVALKAMGRDFDVSSPAAWQQLATAMAPSLTALPILRIETAGRAPIVSKEVYLDATYQLTVPIVSPDPVLLNGKIRGRGQSTWGHPKNPYKVQFKDDASYAKLADVLGMPKNRNWALLADYFDRSLQRNKVALSLGSSSVFSDGLKWTPAGQHIEVHLNGDYVGVYLLTEDIRIAPERLDIRKMSSDPAKNQVDGGYIVEVDFRLDCYNQGDLNLQLVTPWAVQICVDTPDEEAITQAQLAFIKGFIVGVERDIYELDNLDRINLVSFVDWYLLSELFRNVDSAFGSSVFMFKDTEGSAKPTDRLLNLGPLWDFDRSAGNVNYVDAWKTDGCWVNTSANPNWLARLSTKPAFVDLVVTRWQAKRPALATFINSSIDSYTLRLQDAQQRNFERWPILGMQMSNYYTWTTYDQEVRFLRSFLNERIAWLDRAYASAESFQKICVESAN